MKIIGNIQLRIVRLWLWFKTAVQAGKAGPFLWALSFGESFLFAIPVDAFLAAMVLADRARWVWLATVTTLTSTAGAAVGYLIGFFAFDYLGAWFAGATDSSAFVTRIIELFTDHAVVLTFAAALTPIPNGPVVIAAGFVGTNFFLFLLAWFIGRAVRFFGVAYIAYQFGAESVSHAEKALKIGTVVLVLFLLGWFVYYAAGI